MVRKFGCGWACCEVILSSRIPNLYSYLAGVAALSERHVEEGKRAGKFMGELKKLRHSKLGHQSSLAGLQREARANADSFADIQVLS